MHGHRDAAVEDVEVDAEHSLEYVNMGIAGVPPIQKVIALLQEDPLRSTFAEMLS